MSKKDKISESIDTLLDDFFKNHLSKSTDEEIDGESEETEVESEEVEKSAAATEEEVDAEDGEDEIEEEVVVKAEGEDDDEEDEEEDEDEDKKEVMKKKKVKKALPDTSKPKAGNKEADGDMTPEKSKHKKVKKSMADENTEIVGFSDDERAELEAFRAKERERQAAKIQKSIEAEKDAVETRFSSLEKAVSSINENIESFLKKLPASRRLSKSGQEDLAKSETKEVKNTSIKEVSLAKSHAEAAKVMDVLFKMLDEGLCKAKDIAAFEVTGDVQDLGVKTALVGRLNANV